MIGFVHPIDAKNTIKKDAVLDMDGKSYHYAVVMTYSDRNFMHVSDDKEAMKKKFMEKAREYIESLEITVEGFWFDETAEDQRAHCNLHVVSPLPIAYFQALFDMWVTKMGLVSVKHIWEPIGWRKYASRNHMMLTTKDRYTPKQYVYYKMLRMMKDVMDYTLWCRLPTEIVVLIMEYVMYPHGYEEDCQYMEDLTNQ